MRYNDVYVMTTYIKYSRLAFLAESAEPASPACENTDFVGYARESIGFAGYSYTPAERHPEAEAGKATISRTGVHYYNDAH